MGVIISSLTKPLRSFNIENRAQKVFSRQKPIPPPSYPSTVEQLKIAEQVNPDFMKNHYKKDEKLYDRLKHVFVSSHVQQVESNNKIPEKSLPHRRTTEGDFDYGFWEPTTVQIGRCYLKTALKFMTDHMTKPEIHTAETIASQYKLDPKDVGNILDYYRVYQVVQDGADGKIATCSEIVKESIADK